MQNYNALHQLCFWKFLEFKLKSFVHEIKKNLFYSFMISIKIFDTVICPWKEAVESIISKRYSVISTSIEYVHLTSILCTNYWQSAAGQTGNISILKQCISILTQYQPLYTTKPSTDRSKWARALLTFRFGSEDFLWTGCVCGLVFWTGSVSNKNSVGG